MELRCLLGHDFGEPETERKRNEEGNEVVVTVREVKTCNRCGEKQVVSENKEIKSIDQLRETVNVGNPTTSESSVAGGADESGSLGLGTGTSTAESSSSDSAEQWQAEELRPDSDESKETVPEQKDDVDRGVAEIIESAEKDADMLQPDEAEPTPESPAEADADQEDLDEPDASEEDAVILDDDISPEEGREQWDEQAATEEVPGREDAEPEPDDDEDAIIIDEPDRDEPAETEPEAPDPEPAEPGPERSVTEPSDASPTAVEDEDAIIMGGDDEEEPVQSELDDAVPDPAEEPSETSEPAAEEPDSSHTPWPETSEEDEGHDATAPEGEPADIDFGGSSRPEESDNVYNGAAASASQPDEGQSNDGPSEPVTESSPTQSAPEPNVNLERSRREANLEYYCSECGLTREVGNSSMRAGDICPECRQGYISEQQKSD